MVAGPSRPRAPQQGNDSPAPPPRDGSRRKKQTLSASSSGHAQQAAEGKKTQRERLEKARFLQALPLGFPGAFTHRLAGIAGRSGSDQCFVSCPFQRHTGMFNMIRSIRKRRVQGGRPPWRECEGSALTVPSSLASGTGSSPPPAPPGTAGRSKSPFSARWRTKRRKPGGE